MNDPWSLFGTTPTGALVTRKRDGGPQLSNVSYLWDPGARSLLISVTDDRAKTRNLRRDPRASFYVTSPDFGAYAVGEGVAELGAVALAPDDASADALVAQYRALRGEHPDWAEFRTAMVAERRLLVRLPLTYAYGWAPDGR
ncbi:PPOX class F420-dependent oxidoreductase [Streptomyces montanisoli]|uniref:PPOX class F420-dependent oxidoreductase n=1 Tax=Streptomyces montanisoli TaxID=2798581 RepID=A0A940MJD4_9ACTN|nr:PPOX class F420-dependent oxidoreductase [Streptomyces montanisoli]MBP0461893.1 PPOX class F420-dependent oxidoreductase [Streptomyces montanisoli]